MARSDIQAGRAYVELLLKDRSFAKGIAAAGAKLRSFGKGVAVFGAAVAGASATIGVAIFGAVKKFSDIGSALYDMSQRTHESVEALSLFEYATEQTGTSLALVEKAIHKARKEGKSFEEMAAQIGALRDPALQSQKAIELFGTRIGPALVPLLNELPALQKRFEDLGLSLSTEQAAAADAFGDAMTDLRYVVRSFVVQLGSTFAPAITSFVSYVTDALASLRQWLNETHNGIVDALAAGDLLLAAQVTLATLKTMWLENTKAIADAWRDLSFYLIDTWSEAANGIQVLWAELTNFLTRKALEAGGTLQKVVMELSGFIPALFASSEDFARMDAQRKAETEAIDKLTQMAIDGANLVHQTKMAQLAEERKNAIAGIQEAKSESESAADKALENAKKELAALRDQAKQKREGLKVGKRPGFQLPDAGTIRSEIFGSFSAAALQAAGAGGSPEVKQLSELRREERERHREFMRAIRGGGRIK